MLDEAIYKGATRPAMKLGVPLVPLVLACGGTLLTVLWGGTLISWWIAPAALVVLLTALIAMRLVTARDDQRLRQWAMAFRLGLRDGNRAFWQARSYSPSLYKGTSDAWRT